LQRYYFLEYIKRTICEVKNSKLSDYGKSC
jgi:hypothetical protein